MSGETYGCDLGTMNIVSACLGESGGANVKSMRNIFLKIEKDAALNMDLSKITHVEIDDSIFILSEDAYNFANIFGKTANRPMAKGLISSGEVDSIDILGVMVKQLIGTSTGNGKCCYSIPANPVDDPSKNVLYHQSVFGRIIQSLGFNAEAVNEAAAIVYAECENTDFSGIGISFGAGMTNVAVVYKSIPAVIFSVARGGDWIDSSVASAVGAVHTRVTLMKENNLDLNSFE